MNEQTKQKKYNLKMVSLKEIPMKSLFIIVF